MKNQSKPIAAMSRRIFMGSLGSASLLAFASESAAQSASDVNSIIKGLAPIEGQSRSGGYRPVQREPVIVEQQTIYVDPSHHVELEVFFAYDSDRITPRAQAQLHALGEASASPELRAYHYLIAGHTDAIGSDAYNLDLSQRRARTVFGYLTSAFPIDPQRLMVVGFGLRRLKRPATPRAAVNRRVEVLLIVP
jgi:outer membrane protein OmpA-like peptidoglycan-associated protein